MVKISKKTDGQFSKIAGDPGPPSNAIVKVVGGQ
jgi:hypothetical protein